MARGGSGGGGVDRGPALVLEVREVADAAVEEALFRAMAFDDVARHVMSAVGARLGATGGFLRSLDERLRDRTVRWGRLEDRRLPWLATASSCGCAQVLGVPGGDAACVPLDLFGQRVGSLGFYFEGGAPGDGADVLALVRAAAEELDNYVYTLHAARSKQQHMLAVARAMNRPVLADALDAAVEVLQAAIPCKGLAVLYREESERPGAAIDYRVYEGVRFRHGSGEHPSRPMQDLIDRHGERLLEDGDTRLPDWLSGGSESASITVRTVAGERPVARIVTSSPRPSGVVALDLLAVFAEVLRQRLVDYHRERRHLAQFFSRGDIDRLLVHPDYLERYLTPRAHEVAILFADINGFTSISEQVLRRPREVGEFVDRWSREAVDIVWERGGVFDKLVGDCIIGFFGPPFYDRNPAERVLAAIDAAVAIDTATRRMGTSLARGATRRLEGFRGLGVAIGINYCPVSIGLFGPNQDFTAFSPGMNNTARLQGLAGFREIFVMDTVAAQLDARWARGHHKGLRLDGPRRSPVKNVKEPLSYYALVRG